MLDVGEEGHGIHDLTPAVVSWFETERGISLATLDAYHVTCEGDSVLFPYHNGVKTRKGIPDGERKFFFTQGRRPYLFTPPNTAVSKDVAFLVEGETDAMRLWQETGGQPVFGLSGINTWTEEFAEAFAEYKTVFVILDNDVDYNVAERVDAAWREIRGSLGMKGKRIRLPNTVKDVCEFFDNYNLDALRLIAKRHTSESRYKSLDLNQPPPVPKWLVEGLISLGDVTLVPGFPGLGKSWFTMGVAVAVIEGWQTFLGLPVHHHGRVLYLDEENPDDVVFHRLHKLGLTQAGKRNLRYLWNVGVRFDRDPDLFLEEALDYGPTLIVVDSLSQVHTQDENSNGAMSALFKNAVQPLAREVDAAVVVIHHTNKGGTSRGAISVEASVDNVIHMDPAHGNPGKFILRQGKSRRRLGGEELVVQIKDGDNNTVTLEANAPIVPPF